MTNPVPSPPQTLYPIHTSSHARNAQNLKMSITLNDFS